ncbi:hypothetical protein EMIHUDRAFT_427427 [Emiliania huxleyi CCMP1516]|uniref:NLE domain-containing protein n=2 Tax=Emiliania huxleyi TaxID=2903 RepID=A0A0D3J2P3_EMIH1|nr:hypothetical protein EMIHUDRAFT_427427 [Emiliania huxleyi CCMP1516]EOD17778.1 hypothetical protein EMIHUDRAFT_427427 [Emiliania huxleyi CCMP1516]|eukprot:XP_005770207.1 hypothetical protein EMIHUDRAFT_427427 [Emiliania huxleyi CCMP1516]
MTTEPPAAPSSYVPGAAPVPLSQLSISQLRQLASSHGAPATGTRAELEAACTRRGVTAAAPRDIANQSAAPAAGGTLIAQFETAEGERTGPQLDVPADTTAPQLQLILNELLGNEDRVPYAFYVAEEEVSGTLGEALGSASAEQTLRVVYVPQAIFRVRAVTRCTSTLSGHSEAILSAQFSADGRTLATGSGDCCVRLWDVMTETPRATLKAPAAESRLRRRPSSSGALRAPPLPLQAHRDWVLAVAWSPCGKYIASGGKDGRCFAPRRPQVIDAHKKWVNALAWEPLAESRLASASKDGTVRLWERVGGRCAGTLCGHANSVTCLRWGGEGLLYSGSQDRTVKVWAPDESKLVRSLEGHGHWVNCLSASTDFALRRGPFDHRGVAPADEAAAKAGAAQRYAEARGTAELLASGSDDFTVFLWAPAAGKKPIARLTGHVQLVNAVTFSPDGQWLASGSFDGAIRLWAARTGKFVAALRGHVGAVYQLAWSGDSRLLASGSKDSTVKVWELKSRKLKEDLPGHADEVYSVDWSPDGERVASGGKDRNLKMWRR